MLANAGIQALKARADKWASRACCQIFINHFEIIPFTQPKRFRKGMVFFVVGPDSSFHTIGNIEESSNRSKRILETLIPVGIPSPLLHNSLNSLANTRATP